MKKTTKKTSTPTVTKWVYANEYGNLHSIPKMRNENLLNTIAFLARNSTNVAKNPVYKALVKEACKRMRAGRITMIEHAEHLVVVRVSGGDIHVGDMVCVTGNMRNT